MTIDQKITVFITDLSGNRQDETAALCQTLKKAGYSVNATPEQNATLELHFSQDRLELIQKQFPGTGPIYADFASDSFKYRIAHGGGTKQAIAKAVGIKPNFRPQVFDATAGLGRDSFILAALGCQVTLCERSLITWALLADGLKRANEDQELQHICSNIDLINGDSITILPQYIQEKGPPEVIYLDPMFPHRNKSALVKKEMRILRTFTGEDSDSSRLLSISLNSASQRVICKRPIQATPLNSDEPNFSIKTKKHRFDVYLRVQPQ